MASNRPLSARKKLVVRYTVLSVAAVVLLSLLFLLLRERPDAYRAGETVEGITNVLARQLPGGHPEVRFVNVAKEAGIDFVHFPGHRSTQLPEDMGSGVAWGDYDGDGDYDLFLGNVAGPLTASPVEIAASPGTNRLYRNNGDGTFSDVTSAAGLEYRGITMGAAWADYDNDGDMDLVVTTYGSILLYRNLSGGVFENVSASAGLAGSGRFWAGASWGDYNKDGFLDLYVCAYVKYRYRSEDAARTSRHFASDVPFTLNPSSYPAEANALFRNNGDGTFTGVAAAAGVLNEQGKSLTAAWCDFDLDGWLDLYVANDVSDNAMYRNRGDGTFEDVAHNALVSDYRGAMGLAVGDYDNDTDPDIFITHWMAQENGLFWNMVHSYDGGGPPGRMQFMDIADMLGLGQQALDKIGWGTSFFDFDNDGQLDLFVVNGSTFQDRQQPPRLIPMSDALFWQKSPEEGFYDTGPVSGGVFTEPRVGRGAAYADYDNDGDLDLAILQFGESPFLLRNEGGNQQNWLKVRLRGAKSGRDAVGAIVSVHASGKVQTRFAGSQPSYLSQNAPELHFGLGQQTRVERVTVRFPSGSVREETGVAVNQMVWIEE